MINKLRKVFDRLPAVDRSGLVDDMFALGVQRDSSGVLKQAMGLSHSLATTEQDYTVWAPVIKHLIWIHQRLDTSNCKIRFVAAAQKIISPLVSRLGWEPQWHHELAMLQAQAISTGLQLGVAGLAVQASEMARGPVASSLSGVVYKGYGMVGGSAAFEYLVEMYISDDVPTNEKDYLAAMAASSDVSLIRKLLRLVTQPDSPIKTQHLQSLFASVAATCQRIGRTSLLWQFLVENWATLQGRFGNSSRQAMYLILEASRFIQGKENYMEVAKWLDDNGFQGTRVAKWALLNMRINSHFNRFLGNKRACLRWIV